MNTFNRYETKYIVSKDTYLKLMVELNKYTIKDQFSNEDGYSIYNIYFDTEQDELIKASTAKPKFKQKLRLRTYGIPTEESVVFLELKRKYDGFVNKRRTKILYRDAMQLVLHGELPEHEDIHNVQVLKEIKQFVKGKKLTPRVEITYDRIALFDKEDSDIRITFDHNIRTNRNLLDHNGSLLLEDDVYLLEIKTYHTMPLYLTKLLSRYHVRPSSFSKYGVDYFNEINRKSGGLGACLNPYLTALQQ